jgi:crotonobetainyl-CoA:carnitine CoA-transferase CaiB-like acyl-CoA transferase
MLAIGDTYRLQLLDLGAMAYRPRRADPPGLAPPPECTLPPDADQERLSGGGAAGEAIWARCAKVLGHPEWCEDSRFATNQRRMANRDDLEEVMNAVLTTNTTDHRVEVLEAAGVPCGPVYDYAQMFADPQVRHRGLVQYASDPELGEVPHIRTPVRIGEGVRVRTVAPKLGQHNAEIFGRLGVTEAEIKDLRATGVV